MKVEVRKDTMMSKSNPWHIFVDGRCITYFGYRTKREAEAVVAENTQPCEGCEVCNG